MYIVLTSALYRSLSLCRGLNEDAFEVIRNSPDQDGENMNQVDQARAVLGLGAHACVLTP